MDGCAEQYRCATVLFLLLMLSNAYSLIFNRSIGAPVHGREIVDGLNDTEKNCFKYQLQEFNFLVQHRMTHRW